MTKKAMTSVFQVVFSILLLLGMTNCDDPETEMNITEVIQYHGYPVEQHSVVTDDGYILGVFRIPYGKNNTDTQSRIPVFLQHGFIANAAMWVINTPDKNLAYLLAEKGYDVWLGNLRGCDLSRKHETLSPDKYEFWNFSFDEMAKYDIPNMVDYVREKTKYDRIHYIGHSMGTTVAFALLSTKPEYNKKFLSVNALAPVARVDHAKSPLIQLLGKFSDQIFPLVELVSGEEFLPKNLFWKVLGTTVCANEFTNRLCSNTGFLLFGIDNGQFNDTRLPVYMHFYPSPTSTKTAHHMGQILKHNRFQMYDYGEEKNQEVYNSLIPPLYDVTKITAPIALYSGDNDWLATPKDVQYLTDNIKNQILNYRVPFKKFNHIDFLWAFDVIPLLYNKVMETLGTAGSNYQIDEA